MSKFFSCKSFLKNVSVCTALFVASLFLLPATSWATPVPPEDAAQMVRGWLTEDNTPLGESLGAVERVEMYGESGMASSWQDALYYAVFLSPKGIVFVPADDLVEPILAFQPHADGYGIYENSPLQAFVIADLKARVKAARSGAIKNSASTLSATTDAPQGKWNRLKSRTKPNSASIQGISSVSDLRVAPLLKTEWDQTTTFYGSPPAYNYYTPNNYPTGCVPTATGQVMRYFEWPKTGIGVKTFINTVDGEEQSGTTQGGDGKGGPYLWNKMPDIISKSTPTDEIKSVGALLADIGKVLEASYTPIGSGAQTPAVALRLTDTFGYSNAIFAIEPIAGFDPEYSTPTHIRNRINRINPNLDAKLPVFLSAFDPAGLGGHTVVTDGYGYSSSSLYHHINMGWGGKFNAWYALPDIYAMYDGALGPLYASDRIIDCIYNIYTSGTGEIISGRVVDLSGSPVNGASVSIKGAIATVKTDERGIFAFAKVPSNTFYTIETTKDGQLFDSKAVKTGRSVNPNFGPNYGISYPDSQSKECGNVWAVEIKEIKTPATIFTVTFDSQGGSAVSSVTDITYGAIIPAPKSPTRSGYAFDGWYEELSYTTKWDFSADAVTTDMTLYAKWTGTDGSGSGSGGGCDAGVGVLSVLFAAGVILLRCKGK